MFFVAVLVAFGLFQYKTWLPGKKIMANSILETYVFFFISQWKGGSSFNNNNKCGTHWEFESMWAVSQLITWEMLRQIKFVSWNPYLWLIDHVMSTSSSSHGRAICKSIEAKRPQRFFFRSGLNHLAASSGPLISSAWLSHTAYFARHINDNCHHNDAELTI